MQRQSQRDQALVLYRLSFDVFEFSDLKLNQERMDGEVFIEANGGDFKLGSD